MGMSHGGPVVMSGGHAHSHVALDETVYDCVSVAGNHGQPALCLLPSHGWVLGPVGYSVCRLAVALDSGCGSGAGVLGSLMRDLLGNAQEIVRRVLALVSNVLRLGDLVRPGLTS